MPTSQLIGPDDFAVGGLANAMVRHDPELIRSLAQGYMDLGSIRGWIEKMLPHYRDTGEEAVVEALAGGTLILDVIFKKAVIEIPSEPPEEDESRPIWEQIDPAEFLHRVAHDLHGYRDLFRNASGKVPENWETTLQWAAKGLEMFLSGLLYGMEHSKLQFAH
jgi:hypothetical protein